MTFPLVVSACMRDVNCFLGSAEVSCPSRYYWYRFSTFVPCLVPVASEVAWLFYRYNLVVFLFFNFFGWLALLSLC